MKKIQCQSKIVCDVAADGGADGRRDDHRHAVEREGLAALFHRKRIGQDGLLAGCQAAAAQALQNASEDEQWQRVCQSAEK